MKWDMEMEEIEAVLEKIWDLHDKLSDTIHSISRSHFLNSIKTLTGSADKTKKKKNFYGDSADDNSGGGGAGVGYVFVKGFRRDEGESAAIQEAKSLNSIRTALENLEDQLEFFHTIQMQQRAERDVAIARLEQSRIILAMRLAEHHGKKYKVIEEALAFVGDVKDASHFVSPENLYNPSGEKLGSSEGRRSNMLFNVLFSSFNFAKSSLKLDHVSGILGNAALFTISMLAMLHLHQVTNKEQHLLKKRDDVYNNRSMKKAPRPEASSGDGSLGHLDVKMARG